MNAPIADPLLVVEMLRSAGYKNISYAIAELIDNSIEANANNIDIILKSNKVRGTTRTTERISSIGVLDNGIGMDEDILSKCLSFGWGTRLKDATGLGKYGFGLKGAAISQCRRIDVYSWQTSDMVYHIELDLDDEEQISTGTLPKADNDGFSKEHSELINDFDTGTHGTLIILSKPDRLSPKQADTLINHMNRDLCRIFRHFMDDDDTLGEKRNIKVHNLNSQKSLIKGESLFANDPIYQLTPNNMPSHEDKDGKIISNKNRKTNILQPKHIETIDFQGKSNKVEILSSIALPEVQALQGNHPVGNHYANNTGITFVRAGREIELDIKGFFAQSEPRHRWYGIEIRFEPALDALFGVTNNKQSVNNIKKLSEDDVKSLKDEEANSDVELDVAKSTLILALDREISRISKNLIGTVKSRGIGSLKKKGEKTVSITDKATQIIKDKNLKEDTKSKIIASAKTEKEKIQELVDLKMTSDSSLSKEDALMDAKLEIANLLHIETDDWAGNTFLDIQFKGEGVAAIVNRRHPFYDEFYDVLQNEKDTKGILALKLAILAFARAEDTLQQSASEDFFPEFRDKWGEHMNYFLKNI